MFKPIELGGTQDPNSTPYFGPLGWFDSSGRYVITSPEDGPTKIWSLEHGRLGSSYTLSTDGRLTPVITDNGRTVILNDPRS